MDDATTGLVEGWSQWLRGEGMWAVIATAICVVMIFVARGIWKWAKPHGDSLVQGHLTTMESLRTNGEKQTRLLEQQQETTVTISGLLTDHIASVEAIQSKIDTFDHNSETYRNIVRNCSENACNLIHVFSFELDDQKRAEEIRQSINEIRIEMRMGR